MVAEAGDPDDRAMALRTAAQSDGKLALLAELPLFHSWRRHEITDLGRQVELLAVPAGTVLQRQGEPVGQWLVVVDGSVLRMRDGAPVALLPAGSSWGEVLLSREPGGSGWTVSSYDGVEDVLAALEWALVAPR
jgi:hypothetical protein